MKNHTTTARPRVVRGGAELSEIVADGIYSAESTLFSYCQVVQGRLAKLSRVVEVLEDSLSSEEALEELKNKSLNTRFDYYNAFTKIMLNLVAYMERVHDMTANQQKFNAMKEHMQELATKKEEDKAIHVNESKQAVGELLDLLHNEMSLRSRKES